MADLISYNGLPYIIPVVGESDWGQEVTNFLVAIPSGCLQKIGGAFTLTADANFGASFGLVSSYFKSRSSNIASAGVVRLAHTDLVEWRNVANSGNNILGVDGSDHLTYNGSPIEFNLLTNGHIFVGNVSDLATDVAMTGDIGITNAGVTAIQAGVIVNADISGSAAIAYSKLNLAGQITNNDIFSSAGIAVTKLAAQTASRVAEFDGSGFLTASATTNTELSYVSGVTSSIQAQLNAPAAVTSINNTFIGMGRNRVINGDMQIDQMLEGTGAYNATNPESYTLDQWRVGGQSSAVYSTRQTNLLLPTNAGFVQSLEVAVDTPHSVSSGDFPHIEYPIEGPNIRDLLFGTAAAKTISLSFWAAASAPGTYSVAVINGIDTIAYVMTYTINFANTYQHFSFTIPGETSAAWTTTASTFGLKIIWDLGSSATYTTSTLNAWISGAFWKASGSSSLVAGSNALFLTGVQLEIGSVATDFEFLPIQTELLLLQRYFYKTFPMGTPCASGQGYGGAIGYTVQMPGTTTGGSAMASVPVTLMGAPTLTFFNPITGSGDTHWYNQTQGANSGSPASFAGAVGQTNINISNPQVSTDNGGDKMMVHFYADARLGGS